MTRLVTVGYPAVPAVEHGTVAGSFAEALTREDLEHIVDLCVTAREEEHDVLVVYPAWSAEPTLQRLETVRAALDDQRLAVHGSALPPLAGGVLASLGATLGPGAPSAGALVGLLPRLGRQLVTITWLSRLSSLREPAPTITQHATSLLPGTAFAVTSWPEPGIHQLRRKDRTIEVPAPRGAIGVAVAARDGDREWLDEMVLGPLGDPAVVEVDSSPLAREWWGSGHIVECVLYPLDVRETAARVSRELSLRACRWCGQQVATTPCPYCGLDVDAPADEQVA